MAWNGKPWSRTKGLREGNRLSEGVGEEAALSVVMGHRTSKNCTNAADLTLYLAKMMVGHREPIQGN